MARTKLLNIGIDLGTSRSVIACDNGVRTFVPSYVGFPKDAVSRKMFGRDVIFGDEAIKHRMALNLFRPFDKGMIKYADTNAESKEYKNALYVAKALLQHLVDLAKEGDQERGVDYIVRGVIGAPALASRKNRKALLDVARGILDGVMISSEPFTVAYGLNLLSNALIIDIGAGTVDLCRMHGTIPADEDQITTFKAGDYVDQVFYDLITKKYKDVNLTINMVKRFKEENAFISSQGERVFIEVPVKGKPEKRDITDELRQACRTIVPDIVEGIRTLIAEYDPEFQNNLKQNVVLAGGGSQIIGLRKEIEDYMIETLGYGRVIKIEEPLFAGANGAMMLCKDMPDEYWDEVSKR
ncbi:MAG: rod shape-determining protein [Nitrospirae bacterium]|uniref:Magnetosome protein MamK n=1 Tax=uncultured Nitrospirota bacterium TaxID=170969 RepID=A0A142BU42_9BACT|nr:magnetosome protein MamK [uncultured Nitrospirota bacterium]MBF0317290.1 rod shape-determining protein [Nitrospirota bacterium]